jgi:hypothetical protein
MKRFRVLPLLAVALLLATASLSHADNSTLPQLVAQQYGLVNLPLLVESDVAVGTSAVQLTKASASRIENGFVVTTSSFCTIRHNSNVTITNGIALTGTGGSYIENWRDDLYQQTYETWGICNAAAQTIHVWELFLQ